MPRAKKKEKILIGDDSAFMRIIIKNILKNAGYQNIIEAATGRQVLVQYEATKPDLVVLDIIMPGMDGMETLKQLMKIDKKVKVIMITAVGQESIMDECSKTGACGYITKPFKDEEVIKTIEKFIRSEK